MLQWDPSLVKVHRLGPLDPTGSFIILVLTPIGGGGRWETTLDAPPVEFPYLSSTVSRYCSPSINLCTSPEGSTARLHYLNAYSSYPSMEVNTISSSWIS